MKLNLTKIPPNRRDEAKRVAGRIILDGIQERLDEGVSPVKNEGPFKLLSEKYADDFKGSDLVPDLFLYGGLRENITFKPHPDGIVVGVFKSAPKIDRLKASGHNLGDSANKTKRQFIPFDDGDFDDEIMNDVEDALDDFRSDVEQLDRFTEDFLDSLITSVINGKN